MRIGIFFGGKSREREVSFAGGRTVYDLLDKSLFSPIPIFIDGIGNFIELDWQYLYKGSIRDFYPASDLIPSSDYQLYIESFANDEDLIDEAIRKIGKKLSAEDLKKKIDFAFLALHGPYGEDGSIQGILEYYDIPYSGSGVLPSSIGIDKAVQKEFMHSMAIKATRSITLKRADWLSSLSHQEEIFENAKSNFELPLVIKSSTQGSSIGVSILKSYDFKLFRKQVNKSFFIREIEADEWNKLSDSDKRHFIREVCDINIGIGLPLVIENQIILKPEEVKDMLENHFTHSEKPFTLVSLNSEPAVLLEEFIEGKEFSCIVIEDENNEPFALPPTEIIKSSDIFDYRAKYLPGISRKVTPINLPKEKVDEISKQCVELFKALKFDVYARLDGLINKAGVVYLNDPNTTSGMMPSSFFFHQAAEIGLNPTQFLSFIIYKSLQKRLEKSHNAFKMGGLFNELTQKLYEKKSSQTEKFRIAVILGGMSTERHISVESGRNVFEKLSSSGIYDVVPIFLAQEEGKMVFYQLPINLLLKDNADDIRDKVQHFEMSPIIEEIIQRANKITSRFASASYNFHPVRLTLEDLKKISDFVFIALHGRPGEDGTLQKELEKFNIPYNGSSPESSEITINKYITNELLQKNGFLIPKHQLVTKADWLKNKDTLLQNIQSNISFPLIAKPADDGCSSAVKKLDNTEELAMFAEAIFRDTETVSSNLSSDLKLLPNEEFPKKDFFVVEELVGKKDADWFLEITGGILTRMGEGGEIIYEPFEPSEALAEKGILSLEEKFLAGEGQNITPARFPKEIAKKVSSKVKAELEAAARVLNIEGYCRIDAFVRIFKDGKTEVIFIEVNSLPGLTPATCIFHQAALSGYKPFDFLDDIIKFGIAKSKYSELPQTN